MRISDWSSDVCSSDLSEGVPLGAIQVPADGQPIILLNDRQTIGGYPRLGALTPAAVAQLAQFLPGPSLRLRSEESRVAKECVRTWRSMRGPYHQHKH